MMLAGTRSPAPVRALRCAAYAIPTDTREADGTLAWTSTTLIVVHVEADGEVGLGMTYADAAAVRLIEETLAPILTGLDALAPQAGAQAVEAALRNIGRPGLGAMAQSAIDLALWDLKARLLALPLCTLLGARRECVPVYGSGEFTSYDEHRLCEQLERWRSQGIGAVKMKVGSAPEADPARVRAARTAIGPACELFVDANGAYRRTQAHALAELFAAEGVSWFEEPVSSEDLEGLRWLRGRLPAGMAVAAGEYGDVPMYFRRMLEAQAVDVLQADVTRCGGVSGVLGVDRLCRAYTVPLSLHCAPAAHLHVALALEQLAHLEYFHDHVRIEASAFEGVPTLRDGALWPQLDRPGHGLELRERDVEPLRVA
jgi:L-alanine-DL-glutamate epimerase-like enolase superfamily enzyme